MRRTAPIALSATLIVASVPGAAPTVRGTVRAADGAMVIGAEVWLVNAGATGDSTLAATTEVDGTFRFSLPLGGASALVVRRRGFAEARVALGADAASRRTLDVRMVTLAARTAPAVRVVVPDSGAFTGHAAPYYRRLAMRRGDVVTRSDLLRLRAVRVSTALRMLPGVALETGPGGTTVRLRDRRCTAALYLDGTSMGAGRAFDIDAVSTASLLGVELFAQPAGLPMEYQSAESVACGVVGLWTQRDDDQADEPVEPGSVAEPASVRLASEVDEPARLVDGAVFAPRYPVAARAERVGGTVLVELVVDSAGAMEPGSLGVAAAPAPELAAATLRAARQLRFTPARAAGRPVRQLVQMAAEFRPSR